MPKWIIPAVLILMASCGTSSGPRDIDGEFELVAFGGQALPVDQGPVADRLNPKPGCRTLLDQGRLVLTLASGRYQLGYYTHNSCTGLLLGRMEHEGTFSLDGSHIEFTRDGVEPFRFAGRVEGRTIVVDYYEEFVFRRPS